MLLAVARAAAARRPAAMAAALAAVLAAGAPAPCEAAATTTTSVQVPEGGRAIFLAACASCHGADGAGAPRMMVGFSQPPLPDFTDCNFATREMAIDWFAVVHDGGPARGFDRMMPAFGDALDAKAIRSVVGYLRTLCPERAWPRGELNLPLAMFTEKAYPEDELVLVTGVALEGAGEVASEIVYEKRFGPRFQGDVIVPFTFREAEPSGDWGGGIGDIALGVKGVVAQSIDTGSIFSAAVEAKLPTGDSARGFGAGTPVFEGYLALGQIIPSLGFVQLQAGAGFPVDTEQAEREWFGRAAVGRMLYAGGWGRAFTPMVELLTGGELKTSSRPTWDLVPQMQVTLSARQHVRANAAVLVPVGGPGDRPTQLYLYLLWDWFDGGLFTGW